MQVVEKRESVLDPIEIVGMPPDEAVNCGSDARVFGAAKLVILEIEVVDIRLAGCAKMQPCA